MADFEFNGGRLRLSRRKNTGKRDYERVAEDEGSEDESSTFLWVLAGLAVLLGIAALVIGIVALVEVKAHEPHIDPLCSAACCEETETLAHYDFNNPYTPACFQNSSSCAFQLFPLPGDAPGVSSYEANDAAGGITTGQGPMCIDSRPFHFTVPAQGQGSGPHPLGGLDHVKFLAYMKNAEGNFAGFPTRIEGEDDCEGSYELVYTGNVTCQVELALYNFPYNSTDVPFPYEDYRLAACGFNTIAFQDYNDGPGKGAWQVADFFFTKERIFIVNERLPFGKPGFGGTLNDYNGYTSVVPVARRNEDEYHKVAIAFNAHKGTIRYLLDDREVHRINRVGFAPELCDTAIAHGGQNEAVFPEYISAGFGTFSILDAHMWDYGQCKENRALARLGAGPVYQDPFTRDQYGQFEYPGSFVSEAPAYRDRLWGQGAKMCIDSLHVGVQKCGCTE